MDLVNEYKLYLESKNYSKNTIDSYISDILAFYHFIKVEKLNDSLEKIKHERIARYYVNYLSKIELNPKSINRKILALKSFYDYLILDYKTDKNPFLKITLLKTDKKLPQILTENELKLLYESIDTTTDLGFRNYIILDLLFTSGIRASEICNILVTDIYFEKKEILIKGKGKKERIVFLTDVLKEKLKAYINQTRIRLLAKKYDNNEKSLLLNYKGEKLTTRGLRKILNKLVLDTGDLFKIHPHLLRHTFASVLLKNGADLRTVQELLGHKNLKTTQVYTHISDTQLENTFKKLSTRRIDYEDDK